MENSIINGFKWIANKITSFFLAIFDFFVQNIFFMKQKNLKSKYKSVKYILGISILVLCASMYPLMKSVIAN